MAALLGMLGAFLPMRVPARAEEIPPAPGYRVVGRIPVVHQPDAQSNDRAFSGWLILDPANRVGFLVSTTSGTLTTTIQAVDLDTLALGRRVTLAGVLPIGGGGYLEGNAGEVVHTVDPVGRRVFLALTDTPQSLETGTSSGSRPPLRKILVIDERRFVAGAADWSKELTLVAAAPQVRHHALQGLAFASGGPDGRLLLQLHSPASLPALDALADHWLVQWDVEADVLDWAHPLKECARGTFRAGDFSDLALPLLVQADAVHLLCQAAPGAVQVVTVTLRDGVADGVLDGVAAESSAGPALPKKYEDALVDPAGNRFLVLVVDGGQSWYAYDLTVGNWVGAVGTMPISGQSAAGLDPSSGRLYSLSPHTVYSQHPPLPWQGGLLTSDTRLSPPPQAVNAWPQLAYPGQFRIQVDPPSGSRPRRLFLRRGYTLQTSMQSYPGTDIAARKTPVEDHYLVIEDTAPITEQPPADDVDRYTADIDEAPGATAAAYAGSAAGYGARLRLVGGASAATNRFLYDGTKAACLPTDREVVAGTVTAAQLTNAVAAARARPLLVDANTREDWADPEGRCWSPSLPPRPTADEDGGDEDGADEDGLGDRAAECSDTGTANVPMEADDLGRGSAAATCESGKSSVGATARHMLAGVDAPVGMRVGDAWTEASVKRVKGVGVVTTVTSVAKGVEVDGLGTIGVVRTVARTYAGGRRGSAHSDFERTVCGITAGPIGQSGCLSDPEVIAGVLNEAFGTRGRVRLPTPEPTVRGTPGGYLAAVQKPASEEFSDTVINRDASRAVPGLEIVRYTDDVYGGAGRQILQLAGVEASSTYGIYALGGGSLALPGDASGLDGGVVGADDAVGSDLLDSADALGLLGSRSSLVADDNGRSGGVLARLFGRPLLVRTLTEGLLAAVVWLVLGLPAYTAGRRRAFLSAFPAGGAG